jgi:hypothetical protein
LTTFPALIPSTRTYSPGVYPHTVHGVYDGSEARVRHSNTALGVRLRLFFPAITTAELLTVIAHYAGQSGRFLPFAIPNDLLSGVTTPADFTPAGHQWRYAAKPTVEDISIVGGTNLHNLTVELETVPPENTIVKGARLRVRTSLQVGSAQLGVFLDVFTILEAGLAAVADPLMVTATLAPGEAASVSGTDPDFASVSLLLPFNGTNGGTTFTDASSNAQTITGVGNAQTSTAQSKWGGSSLLLDETGDYLTVPNTSIMALGTGDFSIQCWVRFASTPSGNSQGIYQLGSGYLPSAVSGPALGADGSGWSIYHGTSYTSGGSVPSTGVWYFTHYRRASGTVTLEIDGTVVTTVSDSTNYTNQHFAIGGYYSTGFLLNGNLQDLRITKGLARPAGVVPTAAFPTS